MDVGVAYDSSVMNIHLGRVSNGSNGMLEVDFIVESLDRFDSNLGHASEKLANFELYVTHLCVEEIDLRSLTMQREVISIKEFEGALIFDLSFVYLDSEVRELSCFLDVLQAEVVYISQRISACQSVELISVLQRKLHSSVGSLERAQDQLSYIKKQLEKLRRSLSNFGPKYSYLLEDESCDGPRLQMHTPEQQRLVLKMLDTSLATELDVEKKFIDAEKHLEKLNSKLHLADEVVLSLEAETEAAWKRLLEAENSVDIFEETAKEMHCRLQIVQLKLKGSIQREEELKSKRQICLDLHEARQAGVQKVEHFQLPNEAKGSEDWNAGYHNEMNGWKDKVKVLEEKINDSELNLKLANAANEVCHQQLAEMQNIIESLTASVSVAESRADEAEAKVATLTDTNLELTEELGFLKDGDNDGDKLGSLEKQVRGLEKELQHAKASSEASQEQQNMLYSAIWDMETLIEDLKLKFARAEIRTGNAEEQCLSLAETNVELNKEIAFLRTRMESLEASLKEANRAKVARVKYINSGANLITEMVMQLATERERIQKQLYSLARENKILMEELKKNKRNSYVNRSESNVQIEREVSSGDVSVTSRGSYEEIAEHSLTSDKVDYEPSNETVSSEAEEVSSSSFDVVSDETSKPETSCETRVGNHKRRYMPVAVIVLMVSALAVHLYQPEILTAVLRHAGM